MSAEKSISNRSNEERVLAPGSNKLVSCWKNILFVLSLSVLLYGSESDRNSIWKAQAFSISTKYQACHLHSTHSNVPSSRLLSISQSSIIGLKQKWNVETGNNIITTNLARDNLNRFPPKRSSRTIVQQSSSSYTSDENESFANNDKKIKAVDPLIAQASKALRRSSWLSWWAQVILTTISSVTLLFAKTVLTAQSAGGGLRNAGVGGFFLAGSGVLLSFLSIIWTWGETRLSRRLLRRRSTTRISAASITRRAVTIGIGINVMGMLMTILGAEQIVGVLAARSLSFQNFNGGIGNNLNAAGNFVSQTLQPLDILIVQANTNTLLSHFISLLLMLWWGNKWILKLDPPTRADDGLDNEDFDDNEGNEKRRGRDRKSVV